MNGIPQVPRSELEREAQVNSLRVFDGWATDPTSKQLKWNSANPRPYNSFCWPADIFPTTPQRRNYIPQTTIIVAIFVGMIVAFILWVCCHCVKPVYVRSLDD